MLGASEVREHDFSIGNLILCVGLLETRDSWAYEQKRSSGSSADASHGKIAYSVAYNCKSKAKIQKPSQTSKQAIAKAL